MSRPPCCRKIRGLPETCCFKPAGILRCELEEITMTCDEFEALRLADLEGLYQEAAAQQMGVSRQTFGRIVQSARHKVAQALVQAKALRIEGGTITMNAMQTFCCRGCRHKWSVDFGTGRPAECPACRGTDFSGTKASRGKAIAIAVAQKAINHRTKG